MTNKLSITVVQPGIIREDIASNLDNYNKILSKIAKTDLVLFPEMCTTGFTMNTKLFTEETNKLINDWLKLKSQEFSCALVAGTGYFEKGRILNKLIFHESKSNQHHEYNKRHLFSPGHEDKFYYKGKDRFFIEYKGWKIFPQICYDLRFPVWSRNNLNFDVIIYISNWPAARNDHWLTLLKARAIENQAYVIGINRVGKSGDDIEYCGNTCAYRYDGHEIFNLLELTNATHTFVIDKEELQKYRSGFNVLKDRDDFTIGN